MLTFASEMKRNETIKNTSALPLVSVVTVCMNALEPLRFTLDNIARQQYEPLEVVVVDGDSVDGTADFLESHPQLTSRWISEPDGGIFDAMNKGVALCTGEWIIFLNAGDGFAADDVLPRIFAHAPEADVIYGDVMKMMSDGQCVMKVAEEPHNSHRMFFCHQSALTRRDCLIEFPYDTQYRMSADLKLYKQLLGAGKRFVHVPLAVACFDTGGVSNTHRGGGIRENIKIVWECDGLTDKIRLLPRLYFQQMMCALREKFRRR